MQQWQQAFQQECKTAIHKELPAYTPTNWQEEILKQRAVGNERIAEEIERQKISTQPSKRTDLAKPKKKERRKNSVVPFAKEKFLLKNNKQLSIELLNRRDRAEILFAEENGTCLFLQMLDTEGCLIVFLEQLQGLKYNKRNRFEDELTKSLTKRMIHDLPLLFHVLTKNLSQDEFTNLYTLIKYLPKESLLQPLIYQGYPIPLCLALASSVYGRENLRRLRLLNAPSFNNIPIEVFTRIYPGNGSFLAFMLQDEVAKKSSAFMDGLDKKYFSNLPVKVLFTSMQSFDVQLNGRSLFTIIVERYSDLFGKISIWFEANKMEALALLKDSLFDEPYKGDTFFSLCASKYVLFFLNLLKNQLNDYQIATLFSVTDSYGMSALHNMIRCLPTELILSYLKTNNGWLAHLSGDILTRVVHKNGRQYTLFNELCATLSRNQILNMWIKISPQIPDLQLIDLIEEFHLENDDVKDEKFSAFYLLSLFTENNDNLHVLLNANNNLCNISPAALFAIKPENSYYPNTSIFNNLIKSQRGQEILKKLLDLNDNISRTIQVQHLLEPRNIQTWDMRETVPLYWLAFYYEDRKLLEKIFSLEQFIDNAHFREILYDFARERSEVTNFARSLTETEHGLNLLLNLLKNKQFVYLLMDHDVQDGELRLDITKHEDFFYNSEMQAAIYSLLENKYFSAKEIVDLILPEEISPSAIVEKIHNLILRLPGLRLLNLLCTQSAKMLSTLTELLYRLPCENQHEFSLFYELSMTKAGVNLLHLLVQHEEFDLQKMEKDYFVIKEYPTCPFSELVRYKKGQRLLALIFEKDPKVIESIYAIVDQRLEDSVEELYRGTTPLYWLIYHYEDTRLLDYFTAINEKVWAIELSNDYISLPVSRPVEQLQKTEPGKKLLRELFLKESFCNTLLAYQKERVDRVHHDCIKDRIHPMLYESIGFSILLCLLKEQPHYVEELTLESLIQVIPNLKFGQALCVMTYQPSGLELLTKIIQMRSDIAAKLRFEDFLYEVTEDEAPGLTPLYCLVKSNEGIDALVKLIPLIPSLAHGLQRLMEQPLTEDMNYCLKRVRQRLDVISNKEIILATLNEAMLQQQASSVLPMSTSKYTLFAPAHETEKLVEQDVAPILS